MMNLPNYLVSMTVLTLCACASDPIYRVPVNQTVADYVMATQLLEVDQVRKGDRDTWQYVNDRYLIYRGSSDDYLVELKLNCEQLSERGVLPPADYIYDHRYMRSGDTFRGCIVDRIYAISNEQRMELRSLGELPGQRY